MNENKGKLLIVDDNESNRDLLGRRLERKGFDVETASGGHQALDLIETYQFELVLLDLMMPGISGLEVLETLRKKYSINDLPIIMVTAHNETNAIVGCLELGANDYVTKPVDIPVLLARVNAQLDRKRAEMALVEANTSLETKVEHRTFDLMKANETLKSEVAERMAAEERVRLLLESTAEAIIGVDLAGKSIFCNPSSAKLLGFDATEALENRSIVDLMPGSDGDSVPAHAAAPDVMRAIVDGQPYHTDQCAFRREDGTEFPVECWVHPMRHEGSLMGAVVTFVDISERKMFYERLHNTQKLEAVGELAGGIAHEFNNLLMIIDGYIGHALKNRHDEARLAADLDEARMATKRAGSLTKQLLVFSRQPALQPRVVDLCDQLRTVERLLEPLLGETIALQLDTGNMAHAELDPDQLTQCVVNLVINARDAMPDGGRVTLGARVVDLDARRFEGLENEFPAGRYATLYVKDTGLGMDAETRSRIFDPFYTTKPPGSGTGLGLAMVYGFVRNSNAHIVVDSEPGEGSTFTLYFPVSQPADEVVLEAEGDMPDGKGEVVLLVEDEASLRSILCETLEDLGYSVIAACDGLEALEAEEDYEGDIDLLLSDVVMPNFGGIEVARALRKSRPNTKVILMSGYSMHGTTKDQVLPEDVTFLSKPVRPEMLARAIRDELDDQRPAAGEFAAVSEGEPGRIVVESRS